MDFLALRTSTECGMIVFPQFKSNPIIRDWIKLPQIGLVQMRLSRPIPEGFKLKQVRVVRRASGYFVMLSLQSNVSIPDTPASGHPLGIDVGLDKFLATSDISTPLNVSPERLALSGVEGSRRADGELIERPKFLTQLHSELTVRLRSPSTLSEAEGLKLTSDPAASQAAKERASYCNVG